jgi:hypothetical protein
MNAIIRALMITLGVLRILPASAYITFAVIGVAFVRLAGPAWVPLTSLLDMSLVLYTSWRGLRRYRALHTWTKWEP